MNRPILATLSLLFLFSFSLTAQTTCAELTNYILEEGDYITSESSLFDSAIRKVAFYSLEIEYKEYFFALVTFKSNSYKKYTYQIPEEAMDDYTSNYFEDDSDKFWKYIQPYNKVLNCSPKKRQGNKYSPKY